jgi:hypothetical protein
MFGKCQTIKLSGNLVKYSKGTGMQILVSGVGLRNWLHSDWAYSRENGALNSFLYNEKKSLNLK